MPSSIPGNSVPSNPAQLVASEIHSNGNSVNATIGYIGMALFIGIVLYVIIRLISSALSNRYHRCQLDIVALAQPPKLGLNIDEISLLPTFTYRAGKKTEDILVECAVCISELVEGEMVRVLPNCKHFFHVKCIDMWLCSNSSCPMCRANPELEKMKLGLLSASPPLPQLAHCGTMSERTEFRFGSCLGSPSLRSPRIGGSARNGSPCFSAQERDSLEIRIDLSLEFGRHTFL